MRSGAPQGKGYYQPKLNNRVAERVKPLVQNKMVYSKKRCHPELDSGSCGIQPSMFLRKDCGSSPQ
jgi:hypothetical protein